MSRIWQKLIEHIRKRPSDEQGNPSSTPLSSNPGPSPATAFPCGIKVWHACPDAAVDICFVHGLNGNRDATWTAHGESVPWPKTFLPEKLKQARILTYGYDACIVRKSVASSIRLIDHASNLISDLTADREEQQASTRPLIFVVHSLGGIVCKEAMLQSKDSPEAHRRQIFKHLRAIAFMGTPHKGSEIADWTKNLASAVGLVKSTNTSLLKLLSITNEHLESVHSRFTDMVREQQKAGRPLDLACFFEELPLPVVGFIVQKESAVLDSFYSASIHANHMDMVRFTSPEDSGYKKLAYNLARWSSPVNEPMHAIVPVEESKGIVTA